MFFIGSSASATLLRGVSFDVAKESESSRMGLAGQGERQMKTYRNCSGTAQAVRCLGHVHGSPGGLRLTAHW